MTTEKLELTDLRLKNLQPAAPGERYEIADTYVRGLRVRVSDEVVEIGSRKGKAAQVAFVLLARFPPSTNPTRRTLGSYPEMSLERARKKSGEWKAMIRCGVDPAEMIVRERQEAERQRAEAERAERERRSLTDVLEQYEREKLVDLRRGRATRRALDGEMGLLKPFADREPALITKVDIRDAVKDRARTSPISANRQLAYANAFFRWCVAEDIMEFNPAENVRKPSKENERDRHHDLGELREIWQAAGTLGYPFGPLYRLLIALPMRREEVASIHVAELALGDYDNPEEAVWTLPGNRTKNGQPLRVPLAPLVQSIIKDALADKARPKKSKFLFSTTGETPISGFAKGKRRLDQAIMEARAEAAAKLGSQPELMPHWTVHDFRSSFTTLVCDRLEIDPAVADRCLNHIATATRSKIMRTYNRSEMFDQRKLALRAWASLLESQVIGCPLKNVVPIKAA